MTASENNRELKPLLTYKGKPLDDLTKEELIEIVTNEHIMMCQTREAYEKILQLRSKHRV